jgi:SAM-dependent methyltransferase
MVERNSLSGSVMSGDMVAASAVPAAVEQALALFEPALRPANVPLRDGYLDLLGGDDPTGSSAAQRLMLSRLLPLIYERLWRPGGMRMAMGVKGPGKREEQRIALRMLELSSGDRVLDVACGPGNFTRGFAQATGEGLVVGLDASGPMLATAVRGTRNANVAYMRGDACALPFSPSSFDAICCFAALHVIEHPMQALDEMVRVLAPGGRLALLTSYDRKPPASRVAGQTVHKFGGVRMFARDEVVGALSERGLLDVEQRVAGITQFVSARKPAS